MFIFLQETQISFDLYAAVICVALKQNKHASELPLLGKNIPKDHDGIFPPVLPTSISVPPIDINLALFPSGNCVIFSIFLDNRLLFYGINKYATTHISDWNFKASLSSDISTFEMDFIFWTNPVFSFVCLDTIIAKPTSAIFELLSVE